MAEKKRHFNAGRRATSFVKSQAAFFDHPSDFASTEEGRQYGGLCVLRAPSFGDYRCGLASRRRDCRQALVEAPQGKDRFPEGGLIEISPFLIVKSPLIGLQTTRQARPAQISGGNFIPHLIALPGSLAFRQPFQASGFAVTARSSCVLALAD